MRIGPSVSINSADMTFTALTLHLTCTNIFLFNSHGHDYCITASLNIYMKHGCEAHVQILPEWGVGGKCIYSL